MNREITISNKTAKLQSPFNHVFRTFKAMYMPTHFPIHDLAKSLEGGIGKMVSIREIMCKDKDMEHIGCGIYNITIKYPQELASFAERNVGLRTFNNFKILITLYGDLPLCLFCNEKGHIKNQCEKFKTICPTCNKRGHSVCSMASKISNSNQTEDIEEDNDPQLAHNNNQQVQQPTQQPTQQQHQQLQPGFEMINIEDTSSKSTMELNPLSIITSDNITDDQFNPNSIDITKSSISEEELKLYSVTSNKKIINRGKVMPGTSKISSNKENKPFGSPHQKRTREKNTFDSPENEIEKKTRQEDSNTENEDSASLKDDTFNNSNDSFDLNNIYNEIVNDEIESIDENLETIDDDLESKSNIPQPNQS
jgi:hypothetical protein